MTSTSCRISSRTISAAALALLAASLAHAAASLPPKPARYFNDYAGVVAPDVAQRLNARLEALDQERGTQVVVAVFQSLPEGAVLEDFTARTAESWGAGRRQEDDGAVLFVFLQDRRSRLEVGYGLEEKIPDVTAKRIIQDVMAPHFRQNDYGAGLEAAVDSIFRAIRGDASPLVTPGPARARPRSTGIDFGTLVFLAILVFFVLGTFRPRRRGGWTATRGGWYHTGGWGGWGGGGFGGGFGGGGGGGGFSGGGGGFSGGGGSFGGGGASGDW